MTHSKLATKSARDKHRPLHVERAQHAVGDTDGGHPTRHAMPQHRNRGVGPLLHGLDASPKILLRREVVSEVLTFLKQAAAEVTIRKPLRQLRLR